MKNKQELDPDFELVAKYVDAVANLELAVRRDINHGREITDDTVVALSKLISATQRVAFFLEAIDKQRYKMHN